MINPLPILKAAAPYIIFGYEFIRDEIRKSRKDPPVPLPYTAVRRINEASKAFDTKPAKK